jgi:hypothetical protein
VTRGWESLHHELSGTKDPTPKRECESLVDQNPETQSPEIFEYGRTATDFNHWMLGKRRLSIHPIYANSVSRNSER